MKNTKKSSAKASSASQRTQNAWNTRRAKQAEKDERIKALVSEVLKLNDKLHKLENPALSKKETTAEQLKKTKEKVEILFDAQKKEIQNKIGELNASIMELYSVFKEVEDQKKAALLEVERKIEYHNIDLKLEAKINQRF